ncbi:MAG: hypothetical protein WAM92_15125, partial [Mycobacterium sp.]
MSAAPVPSLSQVRSWNADGLDDAARSWTHAAQVWDDAYRQVYREVHLPGGTEWTGAGADAALARVAHDRSRVGGAVHELHAAAAAARTGASQLNTARELVLSAVNDARTAGFNVGEDYSVTSREPVALSMHAAAQAQAQTFAAKIRGYADDPGRRFRWHALPEKPPNPVPEPPPGGWSNDPLMRAAQKIAYGHASDRITGHMDDFPGMSEDQLADLIYQKFQRAINDPRGLRLGASDSDGVPVIYDPKDNVLIVRDTRPNAPDGGTVFKPNLVERPNFVNDKTGWHESMFTPGQLADGPITAPAPATRQGNAGVPGGSVVNGIDSSAPPAPATGGSGEGSRGDPSPAPRTLPGWGTYVPPDQAAESDGPIGILGKIIDQFSLRTPMTPTR